MMISPNELYCFTKSGNEVRAIAPADSYMGQPCWTVERTQGESAGEKMIVPALALVVTLD